MLLSVCAIPAAFFIMVFSRRMAAKVKNMNQLLDSQEETNYNLSIIAWARLSLLSLRSPSRTARYMVFSISMDAFCAA